MASMTRARLGIRGTAATIAQPAATVSDGAGAPLVLFSLMFKRSSLAESAFWIACS
jgi:hypothetical protein